MRRREERRYLVISRSRHTDVLVDVDILASND